MLTFLVGFLSLHPIHIQYTIFSFDALYIKLYGVLCPHCIIMWFHWLGKPVYAMGTIYLISKKQEEIKENSIFCPRLIRIMNIDTSVYNIRKSKEFNTMPMFALLYQIVFHKIRKLWFAKIVLLYRLFTDHLQIGFGLFVDLQPLKICESVFLDDSWTMRGNSQAFQLSQTFANRSYVFTFGASAQAFTGVRQPEKIRVYPMSVRVWID